MKITEIEVIPIAPKLATRYATRRVDLYGIDFRIVYKVPTPTPASPAMATSACAHGRHLRAMNSPPSSAKVL